MSLFIGGLFLVVSILGLFSIGSLIDGPKKFTGRVDVESYVADHASDPAVQKYGGQLKDALDAEHDHAPDAAQQWGNLRRELMQDRETQGAKDLYGIVVDHSRTLSVTTPTRTPDGTVLSYDRPRRTLEPIHLPASASPEYRAAVQLAQIVEERAPNRDDPKVLKAYEDALDKAYTNPGGRISGQFTKPVEGRIEELRRLNPTKKHPRRTLLDD